MSFISDRELTGLNIVAIQSPSASTKTTFPLFKLINRGYSDSLEYYGILDITGPSLNKFTIYSSDFNYFQAGESYYLKNASCLGASKFTQLNDFQYTPPETAKIKIFFNNSEIDSKKINIKYTKRNAYNLLGIPWGISLLLQSGDYLRTEKYKSFWPTWVYDITNINTGLSVFEWRFDENSCLQEFTNDVDIQNFSPQYPEYDICHNNLVSRKYPVYTIKYKEWLLSTGSNLTVINNNNTSSDFETPTITHTIDFNNFLEPRPQAVRIIYKNPINFLYTNSMYHLENPVRQDIYAQNSNPVSWVNQNDKYYKFYNLSQSNSTQNIFTTTLRPFTSVGNFRTLPTGIYNIPYSIEVFYSDPLIENLYNKASTSDLSQNGGNNFTYGMNANSTVYNPYLRTEYITAYKEADKIINLEQWLGTQQESKFKIIFNNLNRQSFGSKFGFSPGAGWSRDIGANNYRLEFSDPSKLYLYSFTVSDSFPIYQEIGESHPKQVTKPIEFNNFRVICKKNNQIIQNQTGIGGGTLSINSLVANSFTGNYQIQVWDPSTTSLYYTNSFSLLTRAAPVFSLAVDTELSSVYIGKQITSPIQSSDYLCQPSLLTSSNPQIISVLADNKTLLINKPGTVTLTASYNGGLCESSTFSASIKVNGTPNVINFTAPKTTIKFDPTEQVDVQYTASASSNLPVTLTSSNTSVIRIENNILKCVGGGTCSITATQNGGNVYSEATPVSITFTVEIFSKLTPSLEWYANTDSFQYGPSTYLTLAFSTNSLSILYTSSNPSVILSKGAYCEITPKAYLVDQAGSSTITAKVIGNDLYKSISITKTINIRKKTQNIIWQDNASITSYYDTQFLPLPSAHDSLVFANENIFACFNYYNYNPTILSAALCNGKLTLLKAGQTSITVSGVENYEYYGSTNTITKTLNFIKQTQQVRSTGSLTSIYSGNSIINPLFSVNNSAYSSASLNFAWTGKLNPSKIIYTSSNPNILCPSDQNGNLDLQGNYLKTIKPGTVTITGIAPGNDLIESATGVTTYTISKKTPTINFIKIPQEDQSVLKLGKTLNLRASSNTNSKIQYISSNPIVASILDEDLLLVNGAGSADIKAKAIEDDLNYSAEVSQTVNIVKIENPVTVNNLPILRFGTDTSLNVEISDSSLLSNVTFSNPIVGNYSYASSTINVNQPGKTSVIFSFNSNAIYNSKIITKELIVKGPPFISNPIIYTKINENLIYGIKINNDGGEASETPTLQLSNSSSLPDDFGLSIFSITGKAKNNGTFVSNFNLSNQYVSTGQNITFQIAPIITGNKNFTTQVDVPFLSTILKSGTVNTYSGNNLPPGLFVVGNQISGTPTQKGLFNSSVSVGYMDNQGNYNYSSETFNFNVTKRAPEIIINPYNVTGYLGAKFEYFIKYNSNPNRTPDSYDCGTLSPGLYFDNKLGLIYGIPKGLTISPVLLKISNAGGESQGYVNFVFIPNSGDIPCLS